MNFASSRKRSYVTQPSEAGKYKYLGRAENFNTSESRSYRLSESDKSKFRYNSTSDHYIVFSHKNSYSYVNTPGVWAAFMTFVAATYTVAVEPTELGRLSCLDEF